jgi:membrane-bound metal-dependent hydrolase YbcI (DUF457 family)
MSGIGHLAVGFALKPTAPKVPLWVLLAASETNDLLYFVFTKAGIEKETNITFDFQQGVRYLSTSTNPWSHGLLMSLVWTAAAALIAYLVYRDRRAASVVGLAVFSHWMLDFLMHSNLPLFFDGSPLLGVGLENTGPGFIFMTALDICLVIAGLVIYFLNRKRTENTL